MRMVISPLVLGAVLALATTRTAQAVPALQASTTPRSVILVAQGCGPGGVRDPYGRCRYAPPRRGYYAPPPPAGRVWVPAHYGPAGRWIPGRWAVR